MKIERDRVRFLSGVRHGKTLGSPIAMMIENRDWPNWQDIMAVQEISTDAAQKRTVTRPRPGHTDLAGSLKVGDIPVGKYIEAVLEAVERVAKLIQGSETDPLKFAGALGLPMGDLAKRAIEFGEKFTGDALSDLVTRSVEAGEVLGAGVRVDLSDRKGKAPVFKEVKYGLKASSIRLQAASEQGAAAALFSLLEEEIAALPVRVRSAKAHVTKRTIGIELDVEVFGR
jgi:hypothetical protein